MTAAEDEVDKIVKLPLLDLLNNKTPTKVATEVDFSPIDNASNTDAAQSNTKEEFVPITDTENFPAKPGETEAGKGGSHSKQLENTGSPETGAKMNKQYKSASDKVINEILNEAFENILRASAALQVETESIKDIIAHHAITLCAMVAEAILQEKGHDIDALKNFLSNEIKDIAFEGNKVYISAPESLEGDIKEHVEHYMEDQEEGIKDNIVLKTDKSLVGTNCKISFADITITHNPNEKREIIQKIVKEVLHNAK